MSPFIKTAILLTATLTLADISSAQKIPIQTKGWVSTLREEKLNQEDTVEIICRDRPLDDLIILLAKTLDQSGDPTNIIFPNTTQFPTVSGRFAGQPWATIENLLQINGFIISEKDDNFIIQHAPPKEDKPTLKTYYLSGLRLPTTSAEDSTRPTLPEVLEKFRLLLQIPPDADNRITEGGRTVGWRENASLTAKRVQYNPDDNSFLVNGWPQDHAWAQSLVASLNRTADPITLTIPETNQTFTIAARQILQIGAEQPTTLPYDQLTWKLQASGSTFIPASTPASKPILAGSIITLWIDEKQEDACTFHITNRNDSIEKTGDNYKLNRSFKTTTTTASQGQPIPLEIDGAKFHIIAKSGTLKKLEQNQAPREDQLRHLIEQFPSQKGTRQ